MRHVHKLIQTGHGEIVDADLSSYFDTLPHAELLKSVARRVVDGAMLHLIKMWLEAPVEETDEHGNKHRSRRNRDEGRGIPQGSNQNSTSVSETGWTTLMIRSSAPRASNILELAGSNDIRGVRSGETSVQIIQSLLCLAKGLSDARGICAIGLSPVLMGGGQLSIVPMVEVGGECRAWS